ncbi:MAG: bifunctional phosphoribosyl-AMP cyclohydrolase/phosphoribosyl-ATP diphosphatase HisIE [Negativicutes bacterium]|nr:bifunctional phosphoribosyl-AMP cyclohydrolase/phosphoribosyl-ATP diphosphatase HisIE [Negativicutes bacterium]
MNIDVIKFNEQGLVPAVIQDVASAAVLMLAYMNEEALRKTAATGVTWFYSRSRRCLWQKGETSGNVQKVRELYYDCDGDTVLVKVEQSGAACHEGTFSCFSRRLDSDAPAEVSGNAAADAKPAAAILHELYHVINDRKVNPKEGSYTNYLFDKGQDKILKKVGEESSETIIASKNNSKQEILYEMADLWYHCLVLLAYHGITPTELLGELAGRRK